MKYKIFAGLGGGFGGAKYKGTFECTTLEQAEGLSRVFACDEYDSYAGLHGLRECSEIEIQEGVSEEEAWEIFCEERESWLDYGVEEVC